MPWEYCSTTDIENYMAEAEYDDFIADVDAPGAYLNRMIRAATGEVIGYIKLVVAPSVWQSWTAATAPDEITDATTWLAICRILPRRDSPMAPGEETAMQKKCGEVREWLEKIKNGDLELSIDMIPGEAAGFQMAVFGEDREPAF